MSRRYCIAAVLFLSLACGLLVQGQLQAFASGSEHSKILGGRGADIGNWPWTVALVHRGVENAFWRYFCAGTLISDRWVVTAAHCLTDGAGNLEYGPGDVHVVSGRTNLTRGGGDWIPVIGYVVHPQYNPNTLDADLALMLLERAPAKDTIWSAITMIPGGDPAGLTAPGAPAWIVGWGMLGPSGPFPPNLHEAQIPLVSQTDLILAYPPPFFTITDNMIGAGPGDGSVDTCQGDSGGPLMVRDGGGNYVLAGVTSWGLQPCGTPGVYGVYVRLANFCGWVKGVSGVGDCGSGGGGGCTLSAGQGLGGEWLLLAAFLVWMARRGRAR